MNKGVLKVLLISFILPLSGCNNNGYVIGEEGVLRDGFVALGDITPKYEPKGKKVTIGDKTLATKESLKTYHNYDFATFNYLDIPNYIINNYISPLVEKDDNGNLIKGMAIGYKYAKNDDNTETWTFQLRENAEWVSNETREKYADVVAEDYVTAFKYIKTYNSNLRYVYQNILDAKALDRYTLEYTVSGKEDYFPTLWDSSVLVPANKDYLEEQGEDFGKDYNHILVNGPFRIQEYVENDHYKLIKNDHYFDKKHVYVDSVYSKYLDNKGNYDFASLFNDGSIDEYRFGYGENVPSDSHIINDIHYSDHTYFMMFNLNRTSFSLKPKKYTYTDNNYKATAAAKLNLNFRKGFLYGMELDRMLRKITQGEEGSLNYLSRAFSIKDYMKANGKDYFNYLNEEYNKNNSSNVSLLGIEQKSDPVYNAEKASSYFQEAKRELFEQGFEGPIYIDCMVSANNNKRLYDIAMLDHLEELSDGLVKFNYDYEGYDPTKWTGIHQLDLYLDRGWGAECDDPIGMLNCFDKNGSFISYFGLNGSNASWKPSPYLPEKYQDEDASKAYQTLFNDTLASFENLYQEAKGIKDLSKIDERYVTFAKAEYELLFNSALVFPYYQNNYHETVLTRLIPLGAKTSNNAHPTYKCIGVSADPISQSEYDLLKS